MAVLWKAIKDKKLPAESKKRLVMKFNKVIGLKLSGPKPAKIPENIKQMADEREKMRINKQFIQADALRKKIESLGYNIEDTHYGPKITPSRH